MMTSLSLATVVACIPPHVSADTDLPIDADYRAGLPDVLVPDKVAPAEIPTFDDTDYRARYRDEGAPGIALFWNRNFSDLKASTPTSGDRNVDQQQSDQLRQGFEQRLLDASTILVDRDASVRFAAITAEGRALKRDRKAVEALAVQSKARQLLQVELSGGFTATWAQFRLIEAGTGRVLMNTTALMPTTHATSLSRTVAGPDGYTTVTIETELSDVDRGAGLAESFMAAFALR